MVWIDLAGVGKRYLNKDHFVTPKDFSAHYEPRPVDEIIHQDSDPNYRVLDISVNTFNDAIQSYHHKCIGGYSPVKLQRYQDLIDRYIAPEIRDFYGAISEAETISDIENNLPELKVISMLNGKYIIVDPSCSPVQNHFAYGNCWFVNDFVSAATPNEEIDMLAWTDLRTTAVIGKDFEWAKEFAQNDNVDAQNENQDTIVLTHYAPNELRYAFKTSNERAAIFSEIYYPKGWKAYLAETGEPIELFRANWMLRGAILPKGEGELVMRFEPESYTIGANISRASSILLILLLIASVAGAAILERKQQN